MPGLTDYYKRAQSAIAEAQRALQMVGTILGGATPTAAARAAAGDGLERAHQAGAHAAQRQGRRSGAGDCRTLPAGCDPRGDRAADRMEGAGGGRASAGATRMRRRAA